MSAQMIEFIQTYFAAPVIGWVFPAIILIYELETDSGIRLPAVGFMA